MTDEPTDLPVDQAEPRTAAGPFYAGHCEKPVGHGDDHYTVYSEGIWLEAAAPAGPIDLPETAKAMPTHDNGCRCWPHVSRADAERMIERIALLEYRSAAELYWDPSDGPNPECGLEECMDIGIHNHEAVAGPSRTDVPATPLVAEAAAPAAPGLHASHAFPPCLLCNAAVDDPEANEPCELPPSLRHDTAEAADRCPWITSTNHLSYRCGLQRGHALPHEPIRARPTEQQGSRG